MLGEGALAELGAFDGAAEVLQAWRDGMAPEPALLVSEWADKHRVLSSRGSAEPDCKRSSQSAASSALPAGNSIFFSGSMVIEPGQFLCGAEEKRRLLHCYKDV